MATSWVRPPLSTLVLLLVGTLLPATAAVGVPAAAGADRDIRLAPAAPDRPVRGRDAAAGSSEWRVSRGGTTDGTTPGTAVRATPGSGGIDATLDLGLTGFTDLAVDPTTGRVFLSEGTDGQVLVVEADGSRRRELDVAGGDRLVPDADGMLWTTHGRDKTVSRIDPVTLAVDTWTLEQCMPLSAVRVRDHVLLGADRCGDGYNESVRTFSATTLPGPVTPVRVPVRSDGSSPYDDLMAVPGDPGSVYAGGYSPSDFARYAVEDTEAGLLLVLAARPDRSSVGGFEIGGTGDLVGSTFEEAFTLDPQTLDPTSSVSGVQRRIGQVVQRADGLLALTEDDPQLSLFRDGVLWRSYTLPAISLYDGVVGLGFGAERLYVVTANTYRHSAYRLHLITPRGASRITVDRGPVERLTGRPITLDLRLEGAPAGSEVVVRGRSRGRWSELARGTTDADGRLQLEGSLVNSTLFEASYAGTPTIDPATTRVFAMARARVRNRMVGATGTRRGVAVYRDGGTAVLSFVVDPDSHRGDCVRVPIEWFEGGVWAQVRQYRCVELRKRSVGAAGLTVQGYPGRRFRMRAEFEGDDTNTASAGPWREFTFRR